MKYDGILIGQAVRDIRTERGLTIEELSDRVDKSVSQHDSDHSGYVLSKNTMTDYS